MLICVVWNALEPCPIDGAGCDILVGCRVRYSDASCCFFRYTVLLCGSRDFWVLHCSAQRSTPHTCTRQYVRRCGCVRLSETLSCSCSAVEAYVNCVLNQVTRHDWATIKPEDSRRSFPEQAIPSGTHLPDRFFLRSCYVTMLDTIRNHRKIHTGQIKLTVENKATRHGIRVLGTPGIGKTTGSVYWILELLRTVTPDVPTFSIVWTLDAQSQRYCFTSINGRIEVLQVSGRFSQWYFQSELQEPLNVHVHDTYGFAVRAEQRHILIASCILCRDANHLATLHVLPSFLVAVSSARALVDHELNKYSIIGYALCVRFAFCGMFTCPLQLAASVGACRVPRVSGSS